VSCLAIEGERVTAFDFSHHFRWKGTERGVRFELPRKKRPLFAPPKGPRSDRGVRGMADGRLLNWVFFTGISRNLCQEKTRGMASPKDSPSGSPMNDVSPRTPISFYRGKVGPHL